MICSLTVCLLSNILWPYEIHSLSSLIAVMGPKILFCVKKLGNEETFELNRSNQNIVLQHDYITISKCLAIVLIRKFPAIMGNIVISVSKKKQLDMLVGRRKHLTYILVQFAQFKDYLVWVQTSFLHRCRKVEWQEGSKTSSHKGILIEPSAWITFHIVIMRRSRQQQQC